MDKQIENAGRTASRREIESIIAHYPDLDDEQLGRALGYLKREASAMDRALIASNADILPQYRQLCSDHYLDRLRPFQIVAIALLALALAAALIWASMTL